MEPWEFSSWYDVLDACPNDLINAGRVLYRPRAYRAPTLLGCIIYELVLRVVAFNFPRATYRTFLQGQDFKFEEGWPA